MSILANIPKYFLRYRKQTPANAAKERLQVIIALERSQRQDPSEYLIKLQNEIIDVIAKYVKIDRDHVKVQLDHIGENSVLELNITMPEVAWHGQEKEEVA